MDHSQHATARHSQNSQNSRNQQNSQKVSASHTQHDPTQHGAQEHVHHHTNEHHTHSRSSSRLTILDAVKLAAMIMMMQGHTLDALVQPSQMDLDHFPWIIWYHFRGFTAPIFLTVSGILFALTMKRQPSGRMAYTQAWKRVRWALILGALGYLQAFPANNLINLRYVDTAGWQQFFQLNILQHNAVVLSLVTVVALFTTSDRRFGLSSAVLALLFCFASPWINSVAWFALLPEGLASLLSYAHGSYFPLFPFASYMFFGAALGSRMRTLTREHQREFLLTASLRLALVLLVAGTSFLALDPMLPWLPQLDVLQSMPSTVLLREGVVFLSIVLIARADGILRRYKNPIEVFGKQSLVIYVVHIVILFGTPWFSSFGRLYTKALPLSAGLVLALCVICSTLLLVWADQRLKAQHRRWHRAMQWSLVGLLGYALLA